jgi:hypothetical protein
MRIAILTKNADAAIEDAKAVVNIYMKNPRREMFIVSSRIFLQ